MKFRFHEAGEHVMDYGEPGAEFFIIIKGKVSVLVPKTKGPVKVAQRQGDSEPG